MLFEFLCNALHQRAQRSCDPTACTGYMFLARTRFLIIEIKPVSNTKVRIDKPILNETCVTSHTSHKNCGLNNAVIRTLSGADQNNEVTFHFNFL